MKKMGKIGHLLERKWKDLGECEKDIMKRIRRVNSSKSEKSLDEKDFYCETLGVFYIGETRKLRS